MPPISIESMSNVKGHAGFYAIYSLCICLYSGVNYFCDKLFFQIPSLMIIPLLICPVNISSYFRYRGASVWGRRWWNMVLMPKFMSFGFIAICYLLSHEQFPVLNAQFWMRHHDLQLLECSKTTPSTSSAFPHHYPKMFFSIHTFISSFPSFPSHHTMNSLTFLTPHTSAALVSSIL